MSKCIVIGGGLAGLTSAVYLSESGIDVDLIEASPKLGGRTYSFHSKEQKTIVDNGQHVLMGCYNHTLEYLTKIDALNTLTFQKHLCVNYVERGGRQFKLEANGKLYPFNLIIGLLKFKAISFNDRIKIIGLFKTVLFSNPDNYNDQTVYEWLIAKTQSKESIRLFWDMLVVSIMNTKPELAAAKLFASTLKKVFLSGNAGSKMIIPNKGLSEVFCDKAVKVIEENNGNIHYSERVVELEFVNDRITKVITNNRIYSDFDFLISAVPFFSLIKFYPSKSLLQFEKYFNYSPIVTVHLWLKENIFSKDFYGFLDSEIHWLFNHGAHISLLTSNAVALSQKTKKEILAIFQSELKAFFPNFDSENILSSIIIKEKRAGFLPTNKYENIRSQIKSDFSNLIFAGDWTNTGLPSTMEGAVKSGISACAEVKKEINLQ